MTRSILLTTVSAVFFVACATTPADAPVTEIPAEPVEEVIAPPPAPTAVELAMDTVDTLVAAGNTQTAIDRLTQLLGDASLTDAEKAATLSRRADLRASANGYDLMGAISDYGKLIDQYGATPAANDAQARLDLANGEATSLNALLNRPETPRGQRFESFFRLGLHEEATDLMQSSGLKPGNDELIAMYQIGYLCDGEDQTGPAYPAVEPDGTARELRFCDLGK